MKKIANVGLLLGVLIFTPSGARCELSSLAAPIYPIPIETISGTVVDQSQNILSYHTGFSDPLAMLAQTFTVGQNGELSAIAIALNASTPIALNVLRTSHGVPTSTILASAEAVIPGDRLGFWTYYDFSSSHLNVHAGEVLAFQPSTPLSGELSIHIAYLPPPPPWPPGVVYGDGTDPYSYGELYDIHPSTGAFDWRPFVEELSGQGPIGGVDATFVTYVAPHGPEISGVPEPSTWAMLLIGFAGIGFLAYRRSRKNTMALTAA